MSYSPDIEALLREREKQRQKAEHDARIYGDKQRAVADYGGQQIAQRKDFLSNQWAVERRQSETDYNTYQTRFNQLGNQYQQAANNDYGSLFNLFAQFAGNYAPDYLRSQGQSVKRGFDDAGQGFLNNVSNVRGTLPNSYTGNYEMQNSGINSNFLSNLGSIFSQYQYNQPTQSYSPPPVKPVRQPVKQPNQLSAHQRVAQGETDVPYVNGSILNRSTPIQHYSPPPASQGRNQFSSLLSQYNNQVAQYEANRQRQYEENRKQQEAAYQKQVNELVSQYNTQAGSRVSEIKKVLGDTWGYDKGKLNSKLGGLSGLDSFDMSSMDFSGINLQDRGSYIQNAMQQQQMRVEEMYQNALREFEEQKAFRLNERSNLLSQQEEKKSQRYGYNAENRQAKQVSTRRNKTGRSINPQSSNFLTQLTRGY